MRFAADLSDGGFDYATDGAYAHDWFDQWLDYGFAKRVHGDDWQKGDFIAFKWHDMPDQVDHIVYVSGVQTKSNGELEPMISSHSNNHNNITTAQFLAAAHMDKGETPFKIEHLRFFATEPTKGKF